MGRLTGTKDLMKLSVLYPIVKILHLHHRIIRIFLILSLRPRVLNILDIHVPKLMMNHILIHPRTLTLTKGQKDRIIVSVSVIQMRAINISLFSD